jgi:hypothetical protein
MSLSDLKIITDDVKELERALDVFGYKKISGFKIYKDKLAIYNNYCRDSSKKDLQKFPYPLKDNAAVASFIFGWIRSLEYGHWPKNPDCDGSTSKGCEAIIISERTSGAAYFDEEDQYVMDDPLECRWDIAILVRPAWLEYHK